MSNTIILCWVHRPFDGYLSTFWKQSFEIVLNFPHLNLGLSLRNERGVFLVHLNIEIDKDQNIESLTSTTV